MVLKHVVVFLAIQAAFCRKQEQTKPSIKWTDDVYNCENMTGLYLDASDVHLVQLGPDNFTLAGTSRVINDFPLAAKVQFLIYRKYGTKYQYFLKMQVADFCKELQSPKVTFWSAAIKEFGWNSCPIVKKNYTVTKCDIPVNPANYAFVASVVGEYKVRIEFLNNSNNIFACFSIYIKAVNE